VTRALLAVLALVAAGPAAAAKKPLAAGEHIDLNRAPVVELMRLPGVGRSRAEAIAAHRARAPFQRVEDVLAVKGVSRGWLDRHRTHLTVGAATAAPRAERPGGPPAGATASATPPRRP
jgi:competence protein ComEA